MPFVCFCGSLLFLRSVSDDDVGRRKGGVPHENDDTIVKFVTMRHSCIIRRIGVWWREDNGDGIVF